MGLLIARVYRHVVSEGRLLEANSLTAEIERTLENAYRDVRIAYSALVARRCEEEDLDFYDLRERVNALLRQEDGASGDSNAVPSGGLLIPTVGVGGHCLPKDGILLWWRALEAGKPDAAGSWILKARAINDASPGTTLRLAERRFGPLDGLPVALLGTAYRFNSEDTRNSPTLSLGRLLAAKGCRVALHDPYVRPYDQNLIAAGFAQDFKQDLDTALRDAEVAFVCVAHRDYLGEGLRSRITHLPALRGVVDGANAFPGAALHDLGTPAVAIGRGKRPTVTALVEEVTSGFRAMERAVASEVSELIDAYNARFAPDQFNQATYKEVQALAATCVTGCDLPEIPATDLDWGGS